VKVAIHICVCVRWLQLNAAAPNLTFTWCCDCLGVCRARAGAIAEVMFEGGDLSFQLSKTMDRYMQLYVSACLRF